MNTSAYAPVSSTRCLFTSDQLFSIIHEAKQERASTGKGNAYARILDTLHKLILPAFAAECGGNLSEIAKVMGIHRETIRTYAAIAEINISRTAGKAGAA
ncbi:MAG: hypothetical protein JG718_17720 [Candidatus Thiothrix moscowensis]|nr:hypothetical protein [Candidatus Thiothrix moscowensis]